ncbi:Zinc finger protein 862 [Nymphon striatum]|nr:Zinc finger protein 862 [Nymphon striatum]
MASRDIRTFFGQGGGDDEKKELERAKKQIEKRKADQKSYDKAKRRRLIQESWLEEFTWAVVRDEKLFCDICTKYPSIADTKSTLFQGISSKFKRESLRFHDKSLKHKLCVEKQNADTKPGQSAMSKCIRKIHEQNTEKYEKLMTTAYYVAQECVAFSKLISLLCPCSKVMESLINAAVTNFIQSNNALIGDRQHGFLHKRSTVTRLLNSFNDWTCALDSRMFVDALYIELAKSFDTVSRMKLIQKLAMLGIGGKLLYVGVPQGSVLGPTLFLLYIVGIAEGVLNSKIMIYADNAKIYLMMQNQADSRQFQEDLDRVIEWAAEYQLTLAYDKCNAICILAIDVKWRSRVKESHTLYTLKNPLHNSNKSRVTIPGEVKQHQKCTRSLQLANSQFTRLQETSMVCGQTLPLNRPTIGDGKTSLFKGITQLESAREKYIKALPFMTSVSESVKQMAHMTSSQSDHYEKLRKDDMEAVLQIKRTVEEKMQNPFHPSLATDKLINISTGQILAVTTLVDAKRLGLKAMDAATTTNADKIVQPKMETFATHLKKIQKKIDTVKEVIREESAVTRALCFAQNLSDEARTEAFSYEWLEYPPSLFEPEKNGYSMRKGCKSTYLSTLQAEVVDSWEPLKELPPSAADAVYVVDAMAFIQRFNTLGSSTFGQLQERYREKLLNMKPRHCTEVHFVGDQYDFGLKSLKGDKRQRRESNINLPEYVPADSMTIPDWKTLLSNPCNKTNMLSYLASRWSQEASWPAGFCLVLGVNAQATRVTQTEHTNVDELYCPNHEEADTRIFAHIASCDDNDVFVIQATDTDIIVLAMYHFPRLPNVVELWVEKNDLFLSIHDLVNESAKAVGKDVLALTDTLLISYILSGCDSVSYPFKRGKKRTVKVALEHVDKHPAFSNCIRHESGPSAYDQVITEARSFFCDLYGKPGYLSLDKLRAHLFASRKLDLRSLPPTEDAFHFHVLRSVCQISLYKQASLSNPVLLPPEEYGRIVDGDRLIPVMKSKPSKPSAAKLKYCKCKKKPNCLRNCPCAKAAVPCIIACACNGDREKCGRLLTDHYDDDDDEAKLITKRISGNLLHSPLYYGMYSQMPDFCDFFLIYANLK